jgi:probable phosphoglycerate mutase
MTPAQDGQPQRPGELRIARHGQAWCNTDQIIGGPASCRGLTPTGRQQAAKLAAHLAAQHHAGHRIDGLYASPLPRVQQTADIIAATLDLPVVTVDDLREPDYGSADGARWADVVAAFGAAPALHPARPIAPGAEPWMAHLTRVRAALDTILNRHPGQTILVVAHGETVTAAHHLFLDIEPKQMLPLAFAVDQASLTTWRQQPVSWLRPQDGYRWALYRHNDVTHLGQGVETGRTDRAAR